MRTHIIDKVKLPCFVKPTDGGSSFGVSKVKKESELLPAIKEAFSHGSEVIVEESIEGREVTCGVYRDSARSRSTANYRNYFRERIF